ncbi:DUF5689 domain-containing protein [Myroides phaeus]|uniref:DUF5689 domain-containing protein n=1 Tax=Myroides phaeus TaxID=702745 RepID=A0A1G8B0E1_9FLAO|nr:DUF5689 domain-containing protein [Myroides phaeus]SDH26657.1 hypothetical protein SAMN05421818_10155 [Myroides phaeus]
MKTIFKSLLYFSFAGLVLTGCAKNDDFSVPNISCTDPVATANASIADIYSKATKDVVQLKEEGLIISGVVISSDKGGNFHQKLHIVDESTQLPAIISIGISGSNAQFPVGTKINLKMDGLYIHDNFGLLNIGGGIYTSSSGKNKYTAAIPGTAVKKYISTYCQPVKDFETTYNNVLTLKGLTKTDYAGKLVTFTDVQFDRALVGKKLYDAADVDAQGYTLRKVVDSEGNSFDIRTGKYSEDFKDWVITSESGSITGIFDVFQDKIQFYPRTIADINLTKDPFEGSTPTDPETPGDMEGKDKDGVDQNTPTYVANFSNWTKFVASTNKFGIQSYAKEAPGQGKDGKGAMEIKGTPKENDYVFTIQNQSVVKGAKAITMWIKGTSSKTLSFNVNRNNGSYAVFNLATDAQIEDKEKPVFSKDITLTATKRTQSGKPENGQNDYVTGSINAPNWIKVTLDLTGVDYNTTGKGDIFSFKVGKSVAYDLVVSDIVFEGGEAGGTPTDPEKPGEGSENPGEGAFFPKNATYVANFDSPDIDKILLGGKLTTGKFEKGAGPNNTTAIFLDTNLSKNGYVYTVNASKTPAGKSKISFYIKGEAVATLSMNVMNTDGKEFFFNPGNIDKNVIVTETSAQNNYIGLVNAKDWVKVTIDLTKIEGDYQTKDGEKFFSVKFGKSGNWNAYISSAFFE